MSDELVIVPSDGDGFTELARTKTGRLFKKHILNLGNLRHPTTGKPIKIDDTFVSTLKKNFTDGVCDIVQVPLANNKNEHTEDPERNIGEVVDLQVKDKKVFAVIDVRDDKHADRLGKTYLGASAMMHLDYTDTKTGKKVGPTLLHTCVTNRPYVTGLDSYEEIVEETVKATSDRSEDAVVLLADDAIEVAPTKEPSMPEKETTPETVTPEAPVKLSLTELFETLKTEHNIDVPTLQSQAAEGTQAAKLTKALTDALAQAGEVKLTATDEKVTTEEVVGAVAALADKNVALSDRVNKLERQDAEHIVDELIEAGRILPAKKKTFIEMRLSNPTLFDDVVPDQPIVSLNNETGKTPVKDTNHNKDIDADVARYVELSATLNGARKK